MPPSDVDTPPYRVLEVIEVTPEVVTSSVNEDMSTTVLGSEAVLEPLWLPPPALTQPRRPRFAMYDDTVSIMTRVPTPINPQLQLLPPRVVAMLRAPIPRREYRFTGPDFYVSYENFMRHHRPNWTPPRQIRGQGEDVALEEQSLRLPSSYLYTSNHNDEGSATCSQRMSMWLDGLPVPEISTHNTRLSSSMPQTQQPREGDGEDVNSHSGMLPDPSRPSAPPSPMSLSSSNNHPIGNAEHRPGQNIPGETTALPACGPRSSLPDGAAAQNVCHPNPLEQHPIVFRGLPIQVRIPQRKSSLCSQLQPHHASSHLQPPFTPLAADDLISGIDSTQLAINSSQLEGPLLLDEDQLGTDFWESAARPIVESQPLPARRNTFPCSRLLCRDPDCPNSHSHHQPQADIRPRLREDSNNPGTDPASDLDDFEADILPQSHADDNNVSNSSAHRRLSAHVHKLFGQHEGKINHKKHARSEVSDFCTLLKNLLFMGRNNLKYRRD